MYYKRILGENICHLTIVIIVVIIIIIIVN